MMNYKNTATSRLGYILTMALIGLLVSCMPQSRYQFQTVELPEDFRLLDSTDVNKDTTNIAEIKWKEFFKEPELIDLIEKGLQKNFEMRDALKTIAITEQLSKQAKLEWLPSLNADLAEINHQWRSEDYYSTPSSLWYNYTGDEIPSSMHVQSKQNITGVNLSWEIDTWGKIRSQKAATIYKFLEAEENKKAVQSKIITQIAESYYHLLLLNAQLEVAQRNFELSQNTYRIVELQYQSGNITALAKQQTKSQMLVSKALIPRLREEIALEENQLSFLTGAMPEEIAVGNTTLWNIETDTDLSYGVPLELINNRTDVRAKELNLRSKNAEVGVAQTNRYPRLKIDLGAGTNAMAMENWLNVPGALFGSVAGSITQPIFNKRKLKTNYEIAKINREKAELDFQRTAYLAVKEVSDALIIINSLDEQLDIAEEQVETTELAIRQSNLLFNSGYATYLEIITAQKVALESELNLNRIRHDILLARIRLYRSLGGGWQ